MRADPGKVRAGAASVYRAVGSAMMSARAGATGGNPAGGGDTKRIALGALGSDEKNVHLWLCSEH